MRSLTPFLRPLVLLLLPASPLLASAPTDSEIAAQYGLYWQEIAPGPCAPGRPCPAGLTDRQAQARILATYCGAGGAGPDCTIVDGWPKPATLSFDHRRRDWTADATIAKRTEEDINGLPTVSVGRSERIVVVVTNTNPLLFTVAAQDLKLQPIDQFADLQRLVGLIGGNISAILQVRASGEAVTAMGGGVLKEAAQLVVDAAAPVSKAQQLGECVTMEAQKASVFVQAVETGTDAKYPRAVPECLGEPLTPAVLRALPAALETTRTELARILNGRCTTLLDAAVALLDTDPGDAKAVRASLAKYDALELDPSCTAWQANPNVVNELDATLVSRVESELGKPSANLPHLYQDLRTNVAADVKKLASATKAARAAIDALPKLIDATPSLAKAAENLELFRERLLQNVVGRTVACNEDAAVQCISRDAVATFVVVPGGFPRVTRWEFTYTRPIKIAVDSPYATDVVARHGAVDTSFSLRSSLASIFDLGVAATKTDLQSDVFGAVRVDDGDGNFGNDRLVVGVVDKESQSGKLAVMLNVVPLRLLDLPTLIQPLGLQVGASADSARPAVFYGLSYGLGKYVRVGWGRTEQRVTVLRDETPLNHPIANAGEIRKRQKYEKADYWSLMVSIRALSLFTAPK